MRGSYGRGWPGAGRAALPRRRNWGRPDLRLEAARATASGFGSSTSSCACWAMLHYSTLMMPVESVGWNSHLKSISPALFGAVHSSVPVSPAESCDGSDRASSSVLYSLSAPATSMLWIAVPSFLRLNVTVWPVFTVNSLGSKKLSPVETSKLTGPSPPLSPLSPLSSLPPPPQAYASSALLIMSAAGRMTALAGRTTALYNLSSSTVWRPVLIDNR